MSNLGKVVPAASPSERGREEEEEEGVRMSGLSEKEREDEVTLARMAQEERKDRRRSPAVDSIGSNSMYAFRFWCFCCWF